MELAITIVTALVTVAGLAFKMWKQKRDVATLEVDLVQKVEHIDKLEKTLVKVTTTLLKKEKNLYEVEKQLAKSKSVGELVDELNGLRGAPKANDPSTND